MIHRIPLDTPDAASVTDIGANWRVVAHCQRGEWFYTGTIADDFAVFQALAWPSPGQQPYLSCVTGRDASGGIVLYARVYPVIARKKTR